MDCQKIRQIAVKYCLNQLSDKEKAPIENHLSICPNCQQYIKEVKTQILPYLNSHIYPFPKSTHPKTTAPLSSNKKLRWQKVLPNILTAISLLLIIIGLALAQRLLTK